MKSTILIIIGLPIVCLVGHYIRYKVLKFNNNYHRLSYEDWKEEMDIIPIPENDLQPKNRTRKQTTKPSNAPMNNASFFCKVQKTRNKHNSYNRCTQKSVQH